MKDSNQSTKNFFSVSVIIPAYNVESCLKRAVLSALKQDPTPLEVIVINDGSTDGTADVARSFGDRIRYLEQPNAGPAAARNTGLAAATGKYVAFLDADDYWLPGFIQATVEFMEAHPEAVAVSTGVRYETSKGEIKEFPPKENLPDIPDKSTLLKNFFDFWARFDHVLTGTVLIRRSKLNDHMQRTDLRIGEDLEFWALLGTLGPWGFIPQVYWYGDSATVALHEGWLRKYMIRRKCCPSIDSWQKRILPKLSHLDKPGFKIIRGRVASNYAHSKILAGLINEARVIVKYYGSEMPQNRVTQVMKIGNRFGILGWWVVCFLFFFREYQKNWLFAVSCG